MGEEIVDKENNVSSGETPNFVPKTKANSRLVAEAQKGNPQAIDRVIELHYKDITYFAMKHVGVQDGEDVTQQAITNIIAKLEDLKDPSKFKSWMMSAVYHECIDYLRKKKRQKSQVKEVELNEEAILEFESDSLPLEPTFINEDNKHKILEMLETLPQNYADCIRLRYHDDLNNKEIAEVLGISDRKVRNDLHRGLRLLEKRIEESGGKKRFYAAAPAMILPALSEVLQAEQASLVTPEVAARVLSSARESIAVAASSGVQSASGVSAQAGSGFVMSTVTKVLIASVAVVAVISGGIGISFLSASQEPTNEAPVVQTTPAQEQDQEPSQPRVIETVADLIGDENAVTLSSFEQNGTTEDELQSFLSGIGAIEEDKAFEPRYTYEMYVVQEQDKQLIVADKINTENGNVSVVSIFGEITDLPSMPEVILMFP